MAKSLGIINPFRWRLIKKTSRDNARTPMQWSSAECAGFTEGTPWLKIHPNYKNVNVETDLTDPDGIISFFKRMNSYRKNSDVLLYGSFKEVVRSEWVYAYERELNGETLRVVCNFSEKEKRLPDSIDGELVISNYKSSSDRLRPYEFRLIKIK
jgi:oligo-1,6-glucosidase